MYGLVRGLNAPPRRIVAPAAATASAVSSSWSRLSTEHGPAMTVSDPSPIDRVEDPDDRVLGVELARGQLERPADRGDRLDAGQRREPAHQGLLARAPISPTTAMTTRSVAGMVERRQALGQDLALHAEDLGLGGAVRAITTNIGAAGLLVGRLGKQKSRGLASARPRHDPCPRS